MPAATSVLSPDAPSPGPLMSQAIICNGMVYCSGSLGLDPQTGAFVLGTTGDRAEQALRNLDHVLRTAGSSLHNVVKVNIFISSMEHYGAVNEIYGKFFSQEPKPCRTCVVVSELGLGAEVEIEAIAHL